MMLSVSLPQLTVAFALGGACFCLIVPRTHPSLPSVEVVVTKLLAASLIPTGVVLVVCAFDTSLLARIPSLELYMAAAGITLLVLALKGLLK
jgi:hypothetical protein